MIKEIYVKNFKCLEEERLELRKLNLLVGINSSGKSSLIQSLILAGNYNNPKRKEYLKNISINNLFNVNNNANKIEIEIKLDEDKIKKVCFTKDNEDIEDTLKEDKKLELDNNLFLLRSSDVKIEEIINTKKETKLGGKIENIVGYYHENKEKNLEEWIIDDEFDEDEDDDEEVYTLESQVNHWLNKIFDLDTDDKKLNFITEHISKEKIRAFYEYKNGTKILPQNLGAGINYVVPLLILCLSAQKGNIIIIENPEVYLHPLSQAKIGEFLSFISSKGIQLIVETHNEHIIKKICYAQYKGELKRKDIIIYYKKINKNFQKLEIKKGRFVVEFPKGFFDATLKEIYEIKRQRR